MSMTVLLNQNQYYEQESRARGELKPAQRTSEKELTLQDAKRGGAEVRKEYIKQKLRKILGEKKYARLKEFIDLDNSGYNPQALHGPQNFAETEGRPGSRPRISVGDKIFDGLLAAENEADVEAILIHELRHARDIANGSPHSKESTASQEALMERRHAMSGKHRRMMEQNALENEMRGN